MADVLLCYFSVPGFSGIFFLRNDWQKWFFVLQVSQRTCDAAQETAETDFLCSFLTVSACGMENIMFTGIVEEIGMLSSVVPGAKSAVLTIEANKVLEKTKVGDSIAVNGVCLTVTGIRGNYFQADVMAETLRRSSLANLRAGSRVNLERAMAADGRFGGHIVAGHIDGTGTILSMEREDNAVWVQIGAPQKILRYIVEKGSIAIDGISLTVAALGLNSFSVSVIPHTGQETILLEKKQGDVVNLENDLVGKYVERLLEIPKIQEKDSESGKDTLKKGITREMLEKYGF